MNAWTTFNATRPEPKPPRDRHGHTAEDAQVQHRKRMADPARRAAKVAYSRRYNRVNAAKARAFDLLMEQLNPKPTPPPYPGRSEIGDQCAVAWGREQWGCSDEEVAEAGRRLREYHETDAYARYERALARYESTRASYLSLIEEVAE